MPRRVRMCGCSWVMSSSRNTTVPGSVRNAPEMQLISVVLPEPFGPIRPKRSPWLNIDADIVERGEAAETSWSSGSDLQQGRVRRSASPSWLRPPALRRSLRPHSPMMPSGAPTTNSTSMMPSTSTLTSEEMVTVSNCCVDAEQDGADHRADPMRGSADQRHRQRRDRVVEIERGGGIGILQVHRGGRAGRAHQRARKSRRPSASAAASAPPCIRRRVRRPSAPAGRGRSMSSGCSARSQPPAPPAPPARRTASST